MAYIYDLTDTWNAGGTTFNGIKLNVTDSASAVSSKLVTLQTNGTEHFSVTKAGVGYFSGNVGIGTSSPAYKLDVAGAIQAQDYRVAATAPFFSTGDEFRWRTTGGTERMRIDSSGNFAIGTSSPNYSLTSYKSGAVANYIQVASGATGAAAGNGTLFGVDASGNGVVTVQGAVNYITSVAGAEAMRIDSSGNVGIGMSAPTTRLSVNGPATAGNITVLTLNNPRTYGVGLGVAAAGIIFGRQTTGDGATAPMGAIYGGNTTETSSSFGSLTFHTRDTTLQQRMVINELGNVGIGTNTPGASIKLDVVGGIRGQAVDTTGSPAFFSASGGGVLYYNGSGVAVLRAYSNGAGAAGTLTFNASGSENMRLDASGNLLVNRSSTSGLGKLNVEGGADFTGGNVYLARDTGFVSSGSGSQVQAGKVGILFNANTNQGLALQETAFGSGSSFILFANLSGTAIGSITQSGTSNVLYNTSSDARLKHDIVDAPDAADLIDAIQVRSFKWNADDIEQRYGFIAQELLEVAPEAVSVPKDPEDTMGVDYSKLVPMLVKELQSLRARVAQLEGAA